MKNMVLSKSTIRTVERETGERDYVARRQYNSEAQHRFNVRHLHGGGGIDPAKMKWIREHVRKVRREAGVGARMAAKEYIVGFDWWGWSDTLMRELRALRKRYRTTIELHGDDDDVHVGPGVQRNVAVAAPSAMTKPFKDKKTDNIININVEYGDVFDRYTFPSTPALQPKRDAWIDVYREKFFYNTSYNYSSDDVRRLFDTIPWDPRRTVMGGPVPRIEVAMWNPLLPIPDGGWNYRYSGRPYFVKSSTNIYVTTLLTDVFAKVRELAGKDFPKYKFALMVGYVDGRDSVLPHQDLGHGSHPIYSFTLYEDQRGDVQFDPRVFAITPMNSTTKMLSLPMTHGTLVVMGGDDFQNQDQVRGLRHTIPKAKKDAGKRINITIRAIDDGDNKASLKMQ